MFHQAKEVLHLGKYQLKYISFYQQHKFFRFPEKLYHKKSDQQLRGAIVLPHGTGKTKRVLVIAKGEFATKAKACGADYVGDKEILEKVKGGWFDFDIIVATPDMMGELGKLGKILGPKGLMPNPKTGTVTPNVGKAILRIAALDERVNDRVAIDIYEFNENCETAFAVFDVCAVVAVLAEAVVLTVLSATDFCSFAPFCKFSPFCLEAIA